MFKKMVCCDVPENNIGFLQRPILLDPCWQTLVDARILVGKLPSREHFVPLELSDPEIVLQEPSPPQKFRLRQSQGQAVRTRHEPVTSWLPGPIYSSCIAYLNKQVKMSRQDTCDLSSLTFVSYCHLFDGKPTTVQILRTSMLTFA